MPLQSIYGPMKIAERAIAPVPGVAGSVAQRADPIGPAYIVDISKEGREAYEASVRGGNAGADTEETSSATPTTNLSPAPATFAPAATAPTVTVQSSAVASTMPAPTGSSGFFNSVYTVSISDEGRAMYEASVRKSQAVQAQTECETCNNRKYVDQSSDATVSFQAPTRISPQAAPALVAAHEQEHVSNEQANAAKDGRRILSQSVSMQTSICPECGRSYISGGETRTVSISESKQEQPSQPSQNKANIPS
ncbi:MAG: hypothetical protein FWH01_14705 [Oscillospiraceae bacterium]|nr:hypothetical protein [Oscillospiraceae bacterium]